MRLDVRERLPGPACGNVTRRARNASTWSYSSNVRICFAVLLLAATLSACSSGKASSRVERCVDRLMQHASTQGLPNKEVARSYVRRTYCARFERKGWVYEDGALRIAAQSWLEHGSSCATASPGEPARTVPCEPERRGGARIIECALLRVTRRSEVRDYIEQLRTKGPVKCDDGTAISDLGVP
jgi:hypothetical protein